MKKWILITLAIFSCSVTYSSDPEKVEALSSKVILQNTNGYFVLTDGSCWKVMGFSKRWRSLSEWWNGVELIPARYECVPNDWIEGSQIEVYVKHGNLNVSEADALNQDALKQCTHLLSNTRTGQVLFAIALPSNTCIVQLFADAHNDGYNQGFEKGRQHGYQNSTEIYNRGRMDGHRAGYSEGYQAAMRGERTPD